MFKLKLFCITDIVYVPNVTQMVQYIVIKKQTVFCTWGWNSNGTVHCYEKQQLYFAPGAGFMCIHTSSVLCCSVLGVWFK